MSLRQGLRSLVRTAMSAKQALPQRAGAGAPIKHSSMPDKPLPLWYDLWWDNGVFPGQPVVDYMYGALPSNLTMIWYAKVWAVFGSVAIVAPIWYSYASHDDFDQPYVPKQYPEDVREVLARSRRSDVNHDFSHPSYNPAGRHNTYTNA